MKEENVIDLMINLHHHVAFMILVEGFQAMKTN